VVVEASIPNAFRTILIIIGAIVLLRFLGQLMNAKRNMEEERRLNKQQRDLQEERNQKLKNFGKVNVFARNSKKTNNLKGNVEDVDFEEVD
jgi:hypothetical protein